MAIPRAQLCAVVGSGLILFGGSPAATADDCRINSSNPNVCQDIVITTAAGHTGTATPDELKVLRTQHNVHIYWQLPQNCNFDGSRDGVFLKGQNDNQFGDMFATKDKHDHPTPSNREKRYHWKDRNQNAQNNPYRYTILFHCDSDQVQYRIDPSVVNEG